jgi:hypothetical protein
MHRESILLAGENVKEISLTQGKVALVDDEDFDQLNQFKWFAHKNKNTFYSERVSQRINGKQRSICMHSVIIGTGIGFVTDHINGNGLDNRRVNLRIVTNRENCQNLHIGKSSKYPGVSWNKVHCKWQSAVRISGMRKHLGYFINEIDASKAYLSSTPRQPGKSLQP